MKICNHCGHRNWTPDKKCEECNKPFKQSAQCRPMIGSKEYGETDSGKNIIGNRIHALKSSD